MALGGNQVRGEGDPPPSDLVVGYQFVGVPLLRTRPLRGNASGSRPAQSLRAAPRETRARAFVLLHCFLAPCALAKPHPFLRPPLFQESIAEMQILTDDLRPTIRILTRHCGACRPISPFHPQVLAPLTAPRWDVAVGEGEYTMRTVLACLASPNYFGPSCGAV